MAQHDYSIANQGFPAFRSDLNNGLAAIVSNNSGATEPTTMFAHQIWVDTAANPSILKIRNADNDAWITIGSINQTADTFTLTSAVSATTLNTSGAVVFNDAGADVDFRVESDTVDHALFVEGSSGNVGIGTSSPTYKLDIDSSGAGGGILRGTRGTSSFDISQVNNSSVFLGTVSNNDLIFNTNSTERARITSGGQLLLGRTTTVNANYKLDVSGLIGVDNQIQISGNASVSGGTANGQGNLGTSTVDGLILLGQGSTNDIIFLNKNGGTAGRVATGATTITTSSDERLKENLQPISNALDIICNLRTVTGNYKADPSRTVSFLIAQDLDAHFPYAVEKSNLDELGINYNWTIPLAMAAIKELKAELDTVKAELATLKGN